MARIYLVRDIESEGEPEVVYTLQDAKALIQTYELETDCEFGYDIIEFDPNKVVE